MNSQRQAGLGFLLALGVLGVTAVTTWCYASGSLDATQLVVLAIGVVAQAALMLWLYYLLSRDQALRQRAATTVGESELRYRRLFETASDGVLLVDAATARVMEANPAFASMLGFTREDVVGKRLWVIGVFAEAFAANAVLALVW